MSTRSGNNKKQAQKHQNKTAFKIRFDDTAALKNQHRPLDRLCEKCLEQIEWKIKFNKYKQISGEIRCKKCLQKTVFKSYREVCDRCSDQLKMCAKCMQVKEIAVVQPQIDLQKKQESKGGVDKALLKVMEDYMEKLRENSRRKIIRLIEKNLITWDLASHQFIYKENNQPLTGLNFRKIKDQDDDDGFEDCSDDDDDDDSDDGDLNKMLEKKPQFVDSDDGFEDDDDFSDND